MNWVVMERFPEEEEGTRLYYTEEAALRFAHHQLARVERASWGKATKVENVPGEMHHWCFPQCGGMVLVYSDSDGAVEGMPEYTGRMYVTADGYELHERANREGWETVSGDNWPHWYTGDCPAEVLGSGEGEHMVKMDGGKMEWDYAK